MFFMKTIHRLHKKHCRTCLPKTNLLAGFHTMTHIFVTFKQKYKFYRGNILKMFLFVQEGLQNK